MSGVLGVDGVSSLCQSPDAVSRKGFGLEIDGIEQTDAGLGRIHGSSPVEEVVNLKFGKLRYGYL